MPSYSAWYSLAWSHRQTCSTYSTSSSMEDRHLNLSVSQVFCQETTTGPWRLPKHTLWYMKICHMHRDCQQKHLKSHGALLYMDLELNQRLHWWLMNGTKLLQRCTVHCSLFSICNYHINLLEWCFVGCFIILFGVASLVMGIACLLPKRKLQTDRVFTSGCLMNSKIDFRLKQLGRCPPFWHPNHHQGWLFCCRHSHARDQGLGLLQRMDASCQSWSIPSCNLSRSTCQIERQPLFPRLTLERLISQWIPVLS